MPRLIAALVLLACCARAEAQGALPSSPYPGALRGYSYQRLAKSPWKALGWEVLAPGAGSVYTGVYAPAATALGISLAGAAIWIAGALRERPALAWLGIGTFAAGRGFGLVSAPVGALLLNAAFRRQLGISAQF